MFPTVMRSSTVLLLLAVAMVTLVTHADAYACNSCSCINASSTESCLNGYCRMSRGTAICICDRGYQGNRCQNRVSSGARPVVSNPCNPNPCQNNGICNQSNGAYFCSCGSGFSGLNCESGGRTNPCDRNVCAANQRCVPWTVGSNYWCI